MELSNKTLAMFLVAAIAVSLFGTLFSLNRLGSLGATGYATSANGTAIVVVNTSTSIKYVVATINWGSGLVNTTAGYLNCTLATDAANTAGCIGFNTVSQGFILENDGNTVAAVTLSSNRTAAQFIGGTSDGGGPLFRYKVANNGTESSSCGSPNPAAYTDVNVTAPGTLICSALNYSDTQDSLEVDIYVNIPYTALGGQKIAGLQATAS